MEFNPSHKSVQAEDCATIRRGPLPTDNYTIISNAVLCDKRLTWAARGMLLYLLSKPSDWQISVQNLINETKDSDQPLGRDGVYKAIAQLTKAGYMRKVSIRSGGGTFSSFQYQVTDGFSPFTDLPDTARPDTANPTQQRTDNLPSTDKAQSKENEEGKPSSQKVVQPVRDLFSDEAIEHIPAEPLGQKPKTPSITVEDPFDTFWAAYPKKTGADSARKAFDKVTRKVPLRDLLEALDRSKRHDHRFRERQFTPAPSKWLNDGSFKDTFDEQFNNDQPRQVTKSEQQLGDTMRALAYSRQMREQRS